MSKENALGIVQRLQSDKQFREQCREKLLENKIEEILQTLKQDGIQADEKDLLEALDTHWIITNLKETTGSIQNLSTQSPTHQIKPLSSDRIDLREELQKGLVGVVRQIDKGYERVMTMYTIAFYLGVFMVVISVFASLFLRSDASVLILGGMGIADIIASLIFQPAQSLQNSRGNLAQLQAAFFSWINDVYNWNRYLQLLDEEATSNNHPPVFEKVREVSDMLVHNTECMMELIECYCEMYPSLESEKKRKQDKIATEPGEPKERAALEVIDKRFMRPQSDDIADRADSQGYSNIKNK